MKIDRGKWWLRWLSSAENDPRWWGYVMLLPYWRFGVERTVRGYNGSWSRRSIRLGPLLVVHWRRV